MGLFVKKEEIPEEEVMVQEEELTIEEAAEAEKTTEIENSCSDEMGIIAAGTTIHGDIRTKGHLAVAGLVDGNVNCAGNLMLTGEIKGQIECNNIVLDGCNCSSILKVKGSVSIKEDTCLTGDISCKHISVMGTVIGSIKATGNVGLTKTANVRGDISAAVLAVEPGAKIKGTMDIK